MPDRKSNGVPLDADCTAERELWDALGEIEPAEPSPALRQGFYRKLEQASRPSLFTRLRDVLGFSGNMGWATAAACLLVGIGTGQLLGETAPDDSARLAALEENISLLNRRLILDRLENDTPSKRLRGVMDAAYLAGSDAEVANALLARATTDRVRSVRAAAIDALGSQINAPAVGGQLMTLLQEAESPVVQLALVDLVLRYGNQDQIDQLLTLAGDDRLHPDLKRHVFTSLKRDVA